MVHVDEELGSGFSGRIVLSRRKGGEEGAPSLS